MKYKFILFSPWLLKSPGHWPAQPSEDGARLGSWGLLIIVNYRVPEKGVNKSYYKGHYKGLVWGP